MTDKPETDIPPPAAAPVRDGFSYGTVSRQRLAGAHPLLQKLFNEAVKKIDIQILQSQRGRDDQEYAFSHGYSKAHFGQSAHNWNPSIALDVCHYPLDWKDRNGFLAVQAVVGWYNPMKNTGHGLAKNMKIPIRWGGDWNMNGILTDEHLVDLPHYELHPWREFAKSSKLFGT